MTRKEQIKEAAENEMHKYPNYCITIPAFKMGAEWADSHPHWISVEDELPKDSCYILVTSRGIVHHWRYGVLESADVLKNMYGITHWMPLPQPPKGGEE